MSSPIRVLAVGYELENDSILQLKREIVESMNAKTKSGKCQMDLFPHFDIEHFTFEPIKSGVFYSRFQDEGCVKSPSDMVKWYEKTKDDDIIILDTLYIHYVEKYDTRVEVGIVTKVKVLKPLIMIAGCHNLNGDKFFSVLSNMTKSFATTTHKTNALKGQYGKPIVFDPPLRIQAKSYIWKK